MFPGFFSVLSTYLAPLDKTGRRIFPASRRDILQFLSQRITNYENQRLVRRGKAS